MPLLVIENLNNATVEYTTDPTTGETGESEQSKVHTYTFGFDIDKVDGANAKTKLAGALSLSFGREAGAEDPAR